MQKELRRMKLNKTLMYSSVTFYTFQYCSLFALSYILHEKVIICFRDRLLLDLRRNIGQNALIYKWHYTWRA